MPIQPSILNYHRSMSEEFKATKNRVRHLLGDKHWQTDGEFKEAIIRRALRAYLPDALRVGRGFVCYPDQRPSTQIDILITDTRYPTLFQEGDTVIVTADAVCAMIEVKTALDTPGEFGKAIAKLGEAVSNVRDSGNSFCQAGLFVYETGKSSDLELLKQLAVRTEGNPRRVVDWIAYGPDRFFRFWSQGHRQGSPIHGAVWHSYFINELAYAYSLSDIVWEMTRKGVHFSPSAEKMWFPLEGDGGEENYRNCYVGLAGGEPQMFGEH